MQTVGVAAEQECSTTDIFSGIAIPPHEKLSSVVIRDVQDGLVVYCFQHEIPDIAEAELERLYGTIFSSLKKLRINGAAKDASTYIAANNGQIEAIFLFRKIKNQVHVLNQVMGITERDLQCFAAYIFSSFHDVAAISFTAVQARIERLSFPFQQFNHSENIVVSLPASEREYWSSLGKSTRHNLNYYRNKLNRDFSPFRFSVRENGNITAPQFRAVLELSKARIKQKGKTFGMSDSEQGHLIELAAHAGLLSLIEIDGAIRAGAICFRAGNSYCLEVIAHDPAFNDYRLGTLCCYLTIAECIARGAREFHFLWGEYDYKYRFLGTQRKLDNIAVYRSPWHMILAGGLALRMLQRGAIRIAKLWKNNPERKKSLPERIVLQSLARLAAYKARTAA